MPSKRWDLYFDLCQVFGHEIFGDHAAIGAVSDLGAVRSKNASVVSSGTLCPMVECGLLRLQCASMSPIAACLAASLAAKLLRWRIPFFSVAKNDSATALSWQLPVRLQERRAWLPLAYSASLRLVYRAPLPAWKIAFSATRPRAFALSSALTTMPAVMRSESDQATTIRVFRSIAVER